MARCCFSRICLILAARREAVEALEDMLLLVLLVVVMCMLLNYNGI